MLTVWLARNHWTDDSNGVEWKECGWFLVSKFLGRVSAIYEKRLLWNAIEITKKLNAIYKQFEETF